ncbi:CxC2 domain-containing protein [Mycena sanguinolenta]|uniref:CxC2 domain-containing protein n=1 Tax=Mycena sanguinolenta TaxID=230812 RepID=A0A8H7DKZ4_9AGAR|nr:CxC2 domain-containing protein [Mycena sanguinolenta]
MHEKKRKRDVYINTPTGDKSTTSTAMRRRVWEQQNIAPPRSPEKRPLDNFDELMGYPLGDDMAIKPVREGPAAITIMKKKRYENSGFVVLHNNGIHVINLDFCSCPNSPTHVDQLLNIGWYPATHDSPATAATLSLLRRFHLLNLQARVAAYDFYNTLVVLGNGSGLGNPPNRLPQFMHMVQEYRHLQMCKCAGHGHDPLGVTATSTGELAIPCCTCPHPGINLPDGWENAPPEVAWIYCLMISKDANFKMKGRDRSSREKDPTLGPGWAYMVANDAYLKHLSKYVAEDEISHCVLFAALWSANNKHAKGLRASGVGSVSCSRHEMFRPVGTGDLQKGKKYSNMDYLFLSSLMGIMLLTIVFTDGLREGHEAELQDWERQVRAWEADNDRPNPYEYPDLEETMADVMLRISQDKHARVVENRAAVLLVKPAAFLMVGIEIEDAHTTGSQAENPYYNSGNSAATAAYTAALRRSQHYATSRKPTCWGCVNGFASNGLPLPAADNSKPETINIYLPSALPSEIRQSICVPDLVEHEDKLRNAQVVEALCDLRRFLHEKQNTHRLN